MLEQEKLKTVLQDVINKTENYTIDSIDELLNVLISELNKGLIT